MNKHSIIKNYLYNLSYKILAIIIPLITTPYVARVLKPDAIGAFSYTQSLGTYFSILGIMGLNLYGQLQIAKLRDDKEKTSCVFMEIFISKLLTSLISLLLFYIFVLIYNKYIFLLTIMSILIIANIFDISWFFQGLEEFKKIVIRNYIIKILGLGLIFIFVKSEKDLLLYASIIQCSTLIGNITLWLRIRRYINFKNKINKHNILLHIKNSLVYFFPAIATTIYTSTDKVMLGAIVQSDYQNGIYDQAHKIEQVIVTIISSFSAVLLPRLAYLHSNGSNKDFKKYIYIILNVSGLMEIPIMIGLFSISNTLIPIFLGTQFTECIKLIKIFSIMILFSGLNTIIGDSCLVAQSKQRKYNIGVGLGAIINIILNALLIPKLFCYGAAIASLVSEIMVFSVFAYFSKIFFVCKKDLIIDWIKYICSALVMGIIVFELGHFLGVSLDTLILQFLSGGIIYFTILFILKASLFQHLLNR